MIISLNKYKGSGGSEKPTEVLTQTITENGSQTFSPQEGYVFSYADITTDVHPTDALVATINENGSHSFSGEYNGAEIITDVHPIETLIETFTSNGTQYFDGEYHGVEITVDVQPYVGNIDITANGIYDVAIYATANVNVQPSDNYSYFDGVVDVEGLRAIGWDDASIGYLRDNDRHYAWQNSDYIVSEENKSLYGTIADKDTIQTNKDDPNFKYCPFFDTSNATDMSYMFEGCSSLTSIPRLDTSNVTDMNVMLADCKLLTSIPQLDTSNVTRMQYMLQGCSSLTSIPLLDTSNVTNMQSMFIDCRSLTSIPQLDTSNATDMSGMFTRCNSLTSIPLLDTSKVTRMNAIFGYTNINTLIDLGGFKNLSISVTSNFLDKCPNLTVESLMNVINNLATVSGQTLKFGSTNLNKLTAEQIAVATNKGWTLT